MLANEIHDKRKGTERSCRVGILVLAPPRWMHCVQLDPSKQSNKNTVGSRESKEDSPQVEGFSSNRERNRKGILLESKDNRFVEGWNPKRILLKSKDDNSSIEVEPVAGESRVQGKFSSSRESSPRV